jgi:outer membrane lipoprotein LolB
VIHRLGPLAIALSLAACVSLPEGPPAADPALAWKVRQQTLLPLIIWEIRGRVALQTAQEGWHAALHWSRVGDRHDIDLSGPLGSGRMRLSQDRFGAQLRDSDQHTYYAENAQKLLYRVTGWDMPFEGLNYWVLGLPAPGAIGRERLDPWGRLEQLEQFGWNIQFLEYLHEGEYEVPGKLFIKRDVDNNKPKFDSDDLSLHPTLELRLVIQSWLKLK